jgi:hypothetical protein
LDTLDLTGSLGDRSFTPPILTDEFKGGVTGPDVAAEEQVPVSVAGMSRHDLDTNLGLVGETNQVCIESNTTVFYERTFTTDEACFLDGSCDTLSTENEVKKENLLAKVWYDVFKDYRTVELTDGRQAMLARSWTEEVFLGENGSNSFDQTYAIEVWIPDATDASQTRRYYTFWSSVTLGGVDDAFYATLVEGGLDEGYQNADNFVDGELCGNDRDFVNDR